MGTIEAVDPGDLVFPITQSYVSDVVLVDDHAIRQAQHALWQNLRIITEPAAAAGIAALRTGAYQPRPGERVAVTISGANTTPLTLPSRDDWTIRTRT